MRGAAMALGALAVGERASAQGGADAELVARARAIHDRAITIDTHVDINPANFTATTPNYVTGLPNTQVDIPKMETGGLDAAFLDLIGPDATALRLTAPLVSSFMAPGSQVVRVPEYTSVHVQPDSSLLAPPFQALFAQLEIAAIPGWVVLQPAE